MEKVLKILLINPAKSSPSDQHRSTTFASLSELNMSVESLHNGHPGAELSGRSREVAVVGRFQLPWVPEAFLARFPVSNLSYGPRVFISRGSAARRGVVGLRPTSDLDATEK